MNFLVCRSLADGCEVACNLPECRCGTQLWVSVVTTPLVDSGDLVPMCWRATGTPSAPPPSTPRTIEELTRRGRLDDGWRVIGEMNSDDE